MTNAFKHCCIIGGSGFIGSYLITTLLAQERKITVIGRNPDPIYPLPRETTYVSGDYGDKYFLRGILQDVDEVVDLAYTTTPQTSFDDPTHDILSNLPAAVNLFQAAVDVNIKKIIFISSGGTVYGRTDNVPIAEDHPTDPISPYGITKLTIEKYARMFHAINGLPVICARPSNAFGERQKSHTGQGFISTAIASVLHGKEIAIFGRNGTIRDYIHVQDVAEGIAALLNFGKVGTCYNLGSGVGKSNHEILAAILPLANASGFELKIRYLPNRPFDVPINILNCRKILTDTGWEPKIPFKQALVRTWNWYLAEYERTKHF